MAVSANSVWEYRTTGSTANGGGFVTGASGTDYSQQNAAQYTTSTASTAAASAAVVRPEGTSADMVGNFVQIISGTNFIAGIYEILSVTPGVNVMTLDRNATTGIGVNGVINIGGALNLGAATDDTNLDQAVNGNIVYFKAGTYTPGATMTLPAASNPLLPIQYVGYNSTRLDAPTGDNRPLIVAGAAVFTLGSNSRMLHFRFTGSSTSVLTNGIGCLLVNVKSINTSTTAARNAITGAADSGLIGCEGISYRGRGYSTNATTSVVGCWFHDSDIGINLASTTGPYFINDTIVSGTVSFGLSVASNTAQNFIKNLTLVGANNVGAGIAFSTAVSDTRILNSIITGFATGIQPTDTETVIYDNYNVFFNNTNDVAIGTYTKGPNTLSATNPGFANVGIVSIATGTTSGSTLTKSGATFVTSGVTAGRDYVYLSAGAGVTQGIYGILSVTDNENLVLDIAPGNSTGDVTARIMTGHNYTVSGSLRASGFPASFPGATTTSYVDRGAVQSTPETSSTFVG